MSTITDTDRLRWLAEHGSSIRSAINGHRNALAWCPITDAERSDLLGTLRAAIDAKIEAEQAQEAAR